ncbi:MAG: glutamine synthetase family protein [Granulosicoccus sp.]|nr:glutamine synthetase family protein [Granulosicoccus sp.]
MTTNKTTNWTDRFPQPFHDWLAGRRVDDVECIVADIAGTSRGKAMPAKKFARSERLFLPTSIFYQTITGTYADIDAIENQWTESDLVLKPDYATATAVPWSADVTMQIIHDVVDVDDNPIGIAPRNVLKRVLDLYAAEGWVPIVAPELEFYLTKPNVNPDNPVEPPIGRTGRQGVGRQAYSMSAVEEYGTVIDDIYDFAEAQGFEIDTIIQEGGAGQIEINLHHGDPVTLADEVFYYKRLIREAALRNDCFATFMAKPMENEPGSAMHIHQSVLNAKTGKNIFNDENDQPTHLFNSFIGGMQKYLPAVFCVIAPYVNSYRRFVRDDSAPINLEWGHDNRTTGLRVPISAPESRRVENRLVGMDCNPYLAIAASLASGYLGMKQAVAPRDGFQGDAYALSHDLPRGLLEALDAFESSGDIKQALGAEFCQVYQEIKRHEIEEFLQVISPWERDHLLLNV